MKAIITVELDYPEQIYDLYETKEIRFYDKDGVYMLWEGGFEIKPMKENSINYYVIENTVNEYESRITGKYATIDEARNDMKNHFDWYFSEPSGNIYHIKEWFDGFNHKVEKKFLERHRGNEVTYKEY